MNKPIVTIAIATSCVLLLPIVFADDSKPGATTSPAPTAAPSPAPAAALSDAEKSFAELLTGATLEGTWQMTTFEEGKEPALGEARVDRYTIDKAEKLTGEHWLITARVQYADKDVALPVPVRVLWAGDTPVITLDTMNLPMLGTYSARVMFHKNFYSGVWYGASYGGVMSGKVSRSAQVSDPTKAGIGK